MNPETQPRKLSRPESELTKFKMLWRDTFTDPERDYWRLQFASTRTQADLRQEIEAKHKIALTDDTQLTRFRRWDVKFQAVQEEQEDIAADKAELELLGLTGDQLRDEILRRMKARAIRRGDYDLGLKAILTGVKIETLQLGHEKFKHASRTKIEAGLVQLGQHIKGNPAARATYDAFYAAVKETTK